jgi:hypothetical protein
MKFVAAAVISFFFAGFCCLAIQIMKNFLSFLFYSDSFIFLPDRFLLFFVQKGDGVCGCLETGIFNLLPNFLQL